MVSTLETGKGEGEKRQWRWSVGVGEEVCELWRKRFFMKVQHNTKYMGEKETISKKKSLFVF